MGKQTRTEKVAWNSRRCGHVPQSFRRRQMKPITEKIRRERINNSLHQLKILVLNAMNKDVLQYAKMEKADILEMAVKYIRCLQTAKQKSQGGCKGPTQGNPASERRPAVKTPTGNNGGSHQQNIQNHPSSTRVINLEASCSGTILPEIPRTHPTSVTMAKQKSHTPAGTKTDYVPLSDFSNFLHRASRTSRRGNNSANCTNMGFTSCLKPSLNGLGAFFKERSPIGEKKENTFSAEKNKENMLSLSPEKTRQDTKTEKDNIRLPGMECFVRNNYIAERLNAYEEKQSFAGYTLEKQQGELQIDHFGHSQYSLPLWRPW